ncbi:MAG: alpha/beta hydrolase family protein [Solirubrobacterales bacterium]
MPAPRRPSETGSHSDRPYWMWLPDSSPPWPGVVIVHGAGSRKENHGDFGRAAAGAGWAALAYDQRGHGDSADKMGPGALGDVGTMARLLARREGVDPERVIARGSSMGGYMAIHAAATSDALAGVIAICPAGEEHLRRGLERDELEFRADVGSRRELDAWLAEHDIAEAITLLAGKPVLLIHAQGDEQIPHEHSELLFERASEPRKLIVLPGGHHRSAQHDAEIQGVALRWIGRTLD